MATRLGKQQGHLPLSYLKKVRSQKVPVPQSSPPQKPEVLGSQRSQDRRLTQSPAATRSGSGTVAKTAHPTTRHLEHIKQAEVLGS